MEQASVLVLLLCAVGISAHALPAYDTVQELSEYPWHETEKEESVIDINKEKSFAALDDNQMGNPWIETEESVFEADDESTTEANDERGLAALYDSFYGKQRNSYTMYNLEEDLLAKLETVDNANSASRVEEMMGEAEGIMQSPAALDDRLEGGPMPKEDESDIDVDEEKTPAAPDDRLVGGPMLEEEESFIDVDEEKTPAAPDDLLVGGPMLEEEESFIDASEEESPAAFDDSFYGRPRGSYALEENVLAELQAVSNLESTSRVEEIMGEAVEVMRRPATFDDRLVGGPMPEEKESSLRDNKDERPAGLDDGLMGKPWTEAEESITDIYEEKTPAALDGRLEGGPMPEEEESATDFAKEEITAALDDSLEGGPMPEEDERDIDFSEEKSLSALDDGRMGKPWSEKEESVIGVDEEKSPAALDYKFYGRPRGSYTEEDYIIAKLKTVSDDAIQRGNPWAGKEESVIDIDEEKSPAALDYKFYGRPRGSYTEEDYIMAKLEAVSDDAIQRGNPWTEKEESVIDVNEEKSSAALDDNFYGRPRGSYAEEDEIIAADSDDDTTSRVEEITGEAAGRRLQGKCSRTQVYGGRGGRAFFDACKPVVAMKELKVCANDNEIESIQAMYEYTNGVTAWTDVRGGTCTDEHHIILKPGEKISAVFGYATDTVRMLTFMTSSSPKPTYYASYRRAFRPNVEQYRRVFGPYGSTTLTDGKLFAVNTNVVSLFGKAGGLLNSIGFFTQ